MEWKYHHNREGSVEDDPAKYKVHVMDSWTRDDGVRIGLAGRGKGLTFLTYRDGSINFGLQMTRGIDSKRYDPEREYEGPYCTLWIIDGDVALQIDLPYLDQMIKTIRDFLLIYRHPRYPHEPLIEQVSFPHYDWYKTKLEQANGRS